MPADQIEYSEKYFDSQYEYRLVFPLKYLLIISSTHQINCNCFFHMLKMCIDIFLDMLNYRMTWRVKCQKRIL